MKMNLYIIEGATDFYVAFSKENLDKCQIDQFLRAGDVMMIRDNALDTWPNIDYTQIVCKHGIVYTHNYKLNDWCVKKIST